MKRNTGIVLRISRLKVRETNVEAIEAALRAHRTVLTEPEAMDLCREYSIQVPEFLVAQTEEDVFDISKKLRFPLVAKIVSPQIIHKTDAGGVVLGIQSPDEARAAFAKIVARVRKHNPESKIEGVMFEEMEPQGIEVVVGATHDRQFGKTLMFGMGGVFVEVFRDVTFRLAPITEAQARDMVRGIQSYRLLGGHRGSPPADESAITHILLAVSKLVSENDSLVELDLNPTIVHEKGATAVDARVLLSQSPLRQPASRPMPEYDNTSLVKFFKPGSVAIVGASNKPGKIGHEVLRNLSEYEYKGKVYPVNPFCGSILGLKTYPSIASIPDTVDLAVLVVPSKLVPMVLNECGLKNVRSVIIVSGGFRETGLGELEKQIVTIAKRHGIRVIGPNCIGVLDGHTRLDTFFHSHDRLSRPKPGSVAFITQSGTFGVTFLEWAAENGIGISKFVSYGNRCDVDEGDLMEFFGEDKETSIIGMYIEGIDDGRRLYEAARKVTPKKPIVALKAGRTLLGSKAAKSHTGWLAGSYEVSKAAFEQAGIVVADDIVGLFDIVKALATQPLPAGANVVMITNGAGPCVMAADKVQEYGMKIAPLADSTVSELARRLPLYCSVSETTVDLTGSATSKDYGTALHILAEDPEVHLLMPFFVFQDPLLDEAIVEVVAGVRNLGKTMVCCAAGGEYTRHMSKRIEKLGVPVYETAERAVTATRALVFQAGVAGRSRYDIR